MEDQSQRDVHFTIECHGVVPSQTGAAWVTYVSSHWIKSCLEVIINLSGTEPEIPILIINLSCKSKFFPVCFVKSLVYALFRGNLIFLHIWI